MPRVFIGLINHFHEYQMKAALELSHHGGERPETVTKAWRRVTNLSRQKPGLLPRRGVPRDKLVTASQPRPAPARPSPADDYKIRETWSGKTKTPTLQLSYYTASPSDCGRYCHIEALVCPRGKSAQGQGRTGQRRCGRIEERKKEITKQKGGKSGDECAVTRRSGPAAAFNNTMPPARSGPGRDSYPRTISFSFPYSLDIFTT